MVSHNTKVGGHAKYSMESLIVLSLTIIAITGAVTGHFGVALMSLLCTVFTRWAFRAILNADSADCYDALDEINTQDADLEREE